MHINKNIYIYIFITYLRIFGYSENLREVKQNILQSHSFRHNFFFNMFSFKADKTLFTV